MAYNLGSLKIILTPVGATCHEMPLVAGSASKSGSRIKFHTIESAEIRSIVHPLATRLISYHRGIDGIHRGRGFRLHHSPLLLPWSGRRFSLRHAYV